MANSGVHRSVCTLLILLFATSASAAVDIDRVSSPVLYINAGDGFVGMYAGYQVINNSGADIDDLWVGAENFSGPFIGLGTGENGFVSLGPLANGQTSYAFIYLQAAAITTGETHDVTVYDGVPVALGGAGTQLAAAPTLPGGAGDGSGSQNGLGVQFSIDSGDTISANSNKVDTTVVGPNPPELGGIMTVTIIGSTGNVGAAAGSVFAGSPAVLADWPADSLQLVGSSIDMTGGNTLSVTDTLFLSGLASGDTDYTAVYTFMVSGPTAVPTSVVPVNYISSGAQIKHTGNITTSTFAPIQPIENYLTLAKSASPTTLAAGGGTSTYTVVMSSAGTIAAELRDLVDTLPAPASGSITYVAGTARLNGVLYPDSQLTINGQQLSWLGPFTIPAGGTTEFTYDVVYSGTPDAAYVNSAIAHIELTQIDSTTDTADDLPATATVNVGISDPCIPSQFGAGCTTDTDGDGTPDSVEGEFTDTDGDGTPDYQEPDNVDTDGDGVNDEADPANADPCIPSAFGSGCSTDTDGDGTPTVSRVNSPTRTVTAHPITRSRTTSTPTVTASTTRPTRRTPIPASRLLQHLDARATATVMV